MVFLMTYHVDSICVTAHNLHYFSSAMHNANYVKFTCLFTSVALCLWVCVCVCVRETQFERRLGMSLWHLTQWSLPRPSTVPEEGKRLIWHAHKILIFRQQMSFRSGPAEREFLAVTFQLKCWSTVTGSHSLTVLVGILKVKFTNSWPSK